MLSAKHFVFFEVRPQKLYHIEDSRSLDEMMNWKISNYVKSSKSKFSRRTRLYDPEQSSAVPHVSSAVQNTRQHVTIFVVEYSLCLILCSDSLGRRLANAALIKAASVAACNGDAAIHSTSFVNNLRGKILALA